MLNQIFISDSFAQSTSQASEAAAAPEFSFTSFVPLLLIFGIFYFLIVRPQSKKMKEHQATVNSLKTGDKIVTSGGIIGLVTDIFPKENQVEIEIADKVKIKILKNYVLDLVKPEEVKNKK
jgi:preprotein translocase subunit YajC